MTTFEQVKTAIIDRVKAVGSPAPQVAGYPGAVLDQVRTGRKNFYITITRNETSEEFRTIGINAKRNRTYGFEIEVYYPWDVNAGGDAGETQERKFDAMLEDICTSFRTSPTLGEKLATAQIPQIEEDTTGFRRLHGNIDVRFRMISLAATVTAV